LSEFTYG